MVVESPDTQSGGTPHIKEVRVARKRRQVANDILHAFHFACDTKDFEIAEQLLQVLEDLLIKRVAKPSTNRATELAPLVAAHERLWSLRQSPKA